MRFPSLAGLAMVALACTVSGAAHAAGDPQGFVQQEHQKLSGLLHQPKTSSRDTQVQQELDGMVDYDELTHRAFGQPCPGSLPACTNDWAARSEAEQKELASLLRQLIQKNYQRNLEKTLDYDVTYKGEKPTNAGDTKIRTEAKSKTNTRDPAIQVDYVVHEKNGKLYVVDIITEGASLTKTYYDQFDKKLKNPAEGYASIVQKLREKIAKP